MATHSIDAKGLQCPAPIMRLFNWSKTAKPDDQVSITATDIGFLSDVKAWCQKTRNELVSLEEADGVITAHIRKGAA